MGVSGCGKSHVGRALAEALRADFIEGDDHHPNENVARMAAGVPLTDADRAGWLAALTSELRARRSAGRPAVLSCSALKCAYRGRLAEAGPLHFVWLDVPVPELERRLAARRHRYMPASLLPSQLATLEPPQADELALRVDGGAPLHEILATVRAWLPASTFSSSDMNVLDSFRLDGRLAMVTGSSAGIGLAIARGLAQAGARVVLNGRDPQRLAQARDALHGEGLAVEAQAFDVADRAAVDAAVDAIERGLGPIEILVNNAGIQRRAPFVDFAAADWDELMRTNLDAVFHAAQSVARRMVPRGRGRIINICSVMSELGRPGIVPYTASKGAVKMLTKGLAADLGPSGITVNGIGPGYFKTELNRKLIDDAAFSGWLVGRTPLRRWGEVEELAGAAVFLASDAARFVNGHILYVDGGLTASV